MNEKLKEILDGLARSARRPIARAMDEAGEFAAYEPNNEAFKEADPEFVLQEMGDWFLSRYCDPSHWKYGEADGSYDWIWGGPFEPGAQLRGRFAGIVGDDLIEGLAGALRRGGGEEWAPLDRVEAFGELYDVEAESPDDPLALLKDRLAQSLRLLAMQGDSESMRLLPNLVYGSAISTFEAFLWETVAYWADNDETVLRGLVTKLPGLRDRPMMLGQIFDEQDRLRATVRTYLSGMVWHRWDKVAPLFVQGFGFRPPSFRPFFEATAKRHHIVHRSSHDLEGEPIAISTADCIALAGLVDQCAQEIHTLISEHVGTRSFRDSF